MKTILAVLLFAPLAAFSQSYPNKPGLGLELNEEFLAKHPPIEGPGYV